MSDWQQPEWFAEAACVGMDPDLFFPPGGGNPNAAKAICFRCPVREECLDYALDNSILHGTWGGLTEKERRRVRTHRRNQRNHEDRVAHERQRLILALAPRLETYPCPNGCGKLCKGLKGVAVHLNTCPSTAPRSIP